MPERIVSSEEIEERIGFEKFHIRKGMIKIFTGVMLRRYAGEEQQASDMAAMAAQKAIENAGMRPKDIDVLIYTAITQDFAEPATANVVQHKIGATNAVCFDVKNACNAFLNGMDLGDSIIKAGKGKTVLVTAGEVLSRMVRFDYDDPELIKKRCATFSVGDGGGAFVLSASDTENGISRIEFKSLGDYWMHNVIWGGGVMYPRDPDKFCLTGDTNELLRLHFEYTMDFYKNSMEKSGWPTHEIKLVIPSQITKYLAIKTIEKLEISADKLVDILTEFGNIGAASIPVAMCLAVDEGLMQQGQKNKLMLFGAASGLSLGCICVEY